MFIMLTLMFTIFLPILSLPLNVISFIISKKHKKIYALFTAISLAAIAYTWIPDNVYDLYRWHKEVMMFSNYSLEDLFEIIVIKYEPINYIIKYICSRLGDINLLQFIVTFLGYYGILWIISDCSKDKKIGSLYFGIISILIISSIGYINFISGLWFNFAIICFAIGVYIDYFKKSKYIRWVFYLVAICIHISTIYLLLILFITKIIKSKRYLSVVIVSFILSLFIGPILLYLNDTFNLDLIHYIYNLYETYFINANQFGNLHNGVNLYEAILKISICIIYIFITNNKLKKYNNQYLMYLSIIIPSIIALVFNAKIMIVRYSFFIILILIPMIIDYYNQKKSKKYIFLIIYICLLISFMTYRQFNSIKKANLYDGIVINIKSNIFQLKNENK